MLSAAARSALRRSGSIGNLGYGIFHVQPLARLLDDGGNATARCPNAYRHVVKDWSWLNRITVDTQGFDSSAATERAGRPSERHFHVLFMSHPPICLEG